GTDVWYLHVTFCAACHEPILDVLRRAPGTQHGYGLVKGKWRVWPKGATRPPVPTQVPAELASDYTEACLVVSDSPKAAAALGRRCLQHLLRSAAHVKPSDLAK